MANYDIPTYPLKGLCYFNNQFLIEEGFIDDQAFHIADRRAQRRALCATGVTEGLTVSLGTGKLTVAPGTAIELAGAYIRNIALAAAFFAAAEATPVPEQHLLHATHREYQKLGRMVDDAAFGGRA